VQFLHASYAQQLTLRDSVKCRRLIESPWYQDLWGERFTLNSDQNTKSRFSNDKGGERLITSVGAAVTGEGGSIIVVDDPNAASEAFSEATIQATIDWWDGAMSTRLNDPKTGAYVIIQQRLAEDDLTGHIQEKENDGWTQLILPMRYEPDRVFPSAIGWKDPRTKAGELLWPERFGEQEVTLLEKSLGPFSAAGQLQQRPEPAGGGVIKREWWKLWESETFPPMDFIIGSLDTAYTLKTTNDFSALTIWGVFTGDSIGHDIRLLDGSVERKYAENAPRVMLMNAWQKRLELHELVEEVTKTCRKYKVDKLLIENKAAGISVSQELRRLYNNERFSVQLHDPKSIDKLSRLYSVQHLFSEGMVFAPDRAWAEMTITQVGQFPKGKHDDIVDTVSQALRHLRDLGLLTRAPERIEELEAMKTYPGGQGQPLYPA
jgi:predicted phage terminase large subunit-like protein